MALIVGGLVLMALVALTYYVYLTEMDAARARVSSGSQVVNTPCGSIEYADVGEKPADPCDSWRGSSFDQGLEFGAAIN